MTRYTWSWHGDNKDIWRVQDPRGFELEIGGENVYNIIESVGIEKGGIIPGKWTCFVCQKRATTGGECMHLQKSWKEEGDKSAFIS